MRNIEDIPFFLVIIGVMGNAIIGLIFKTPFILLMIRSIIVTIIFSLLGYIVMIITLEINKKSNAKKDLAHNHSVDYSVPPISEEEFIQYEEDDFVETNPADLHKYNSNN